MRYLYEGNLSCHSPYDTLGTLLEGTIFNRYATNFRAYPQNDGGKSMDEIMDISRVHNITHVMLGTDDEEVRQTRTYFTLRASANRCNFSFHFQIL